MAGKNAIIDGGGFHHIALRAHDFDKSVRFYTQGLGFTEKIAWGEKPRRAIMLDAGDGNYLEIFERPDHPPAGDHDLLLHFALRTSDTTGAAERARAAGAEIITEPKDATINSRPSPTPVRLAFCKGPDGEVIEFFQNEKT